MVDRLPEYGCASGPSYTPEYDAAEASSNLWAGFPDRAKSNVG